ncbi:carbamoyltransferase HypF [Vibrio sp. JC009]|uniref:carbamoyltransferase HypF n=1 Tax=Vibrio sp. JC009 TaxID=2912314 RepID=UPI0023B1DA9A|nr:carbamoyltransferase HypF [Vibrio sp. JC009]WED21731.1 carbamoyltransferase HypF [Vibrio sp. JC009]
MNGVEIRVKGKVQGVGFRPFVWQLAHDLGLKGEVLNDGQGVLVRLLADHNTTLFQSRLESDLPPLAQIDTQTSEPFYWSELPADFQIVQSESTAMDTQVVPDAATCPECLNELYNREDPRYQYPFINCTHCGPRFTIINALPYDRPKTVMAHFPLCETCQSEYSDPADRRYHAQPVACPECGPQVWLSNSNGEPISGDWLSVCVNALTQGKVIAIKSVGGFHLACDATNREAVQSLRDKKHRQFKPFAVMAADLNQIAKLAVYSENESAALESSAAPIVLLQKKTDSELASNIAPELNEVGIMLPSNPVQHLLATHFAKPVVMTSGNGSGLPPALSNEESLRFLGDIADLFIMHNREIVTRCDDSLIRLNSDGEQQTLRRSRGFVPDAVNLPDGFPCADGFIAYGGDLKNSFAIGKGNQIIISQYLGDLSNIETQSQYKQAIEHFEDIYQVESSYHVADLHSGYFSHQFAKSRTERPVLVQHHHAHFAACLIENGWKQEHGKVLALTLDGLGLGDDGELWGSELMLADYSGYERIGGIPAITLVGGDTAAKQPWRSFYAHLKQFQPELSDEFLESLFPGKPLSLINNAAQSGINTHKIRSAGRLFDAVAASLDISFDQIEYEGQAACQLEAIASRAESEQISTSIRIETEGMNLELSTFWKQWLTLDANQEDKAFIFHKALAEALAEIVIKAQKQYNVSALVLTGGVFHNALLTKLIQVSLKGQIEILQHKNFSCGDGSLALGQLAVALHQKT